MQGAAVGSVMGGVLAQMAAASAPPGRRDQQGYHAGPTAFDERQFRQMRAMRRRVSARDADPFEDTLFPSPDAGMMMPREFASFRSLPGQAMHNAQLAELFGMMQQAQEPEMRPAEGHTIAALPTHTVTAEEVHAMPDDHKTCTICMEAFKEGDTQRMLPCFHRFHASCVDQWLSQQGECPLCKHRVDHVETTGSA